MSRHPLNARRIAVLVVALLVVLGVLSSEPLHRALLDLLAAAEQVMRAYPRLGMALFFALAGFSAMLSFFSSAALVPVGVFVWGPTVTMLLLWSGGTVGGILGYWFARTLGRRAVKRMFPDAPLRKYETFFSTRADWRTILLFRLALQSELPSYVLGLVRYPLPRYLPIILVAEALFVLLEIYLGAAFLERSAATFIGALVVAAVLMAWAWRRLQRAMAEAPAP
ncbi:MAG: VTT domain-containing protein [Gemmatimonadales bacterium]|nr:VTT domain-containing protein [Gemmatimonadales bacterium]